MNEINILLKEEQKNIKELEDITIKIVDLKRNMFQDVWKIGAELNKVKDKRLFLAKYPTFETYLEQDVKFGRTSAYSFMKIANEMDVQTLEHYGTTKCGLLVTLDKEKREKFIKTYTEPIIKDMSVRKLDGEIRGFNKPESDFEDECDVDREYFLEYLELLEDIWRDMTHLKEKVLSAKDYEDSCLGARNDAFNKYEYKHKIIELQNKIKEEK